MQIAVFIDRNNLFIAYIDNSLGLIGQIYSNPSIFQFHIDKGNMMLGEHRMCDTTYFHLDFSLLKNWHDRNMFFVAGIHRIRHQFLHIFTTTNH